MQNSKTSSLSNYISKIIKLTPHPTTDDDMLLSLQPELVFRGVSNSEYKLVPSLGRPVSPNIFNSLQIFEKNLIESAQQRFPSLFPDSDYPIVRLAKLQHYGIPTRLMDVSSNALVALYFACQNSKNNTETNGAVYVMSGICHSAYHPVANVIADAYKLTNSNAFMDMKIYYYRALQQPYYSSKLYPNSHDLSEGNLKRFVESMSQPILIDAGDFCERQKHQQGKFILFPNKVFKASSQNKYSSNELMSLIGKQSMIKVISKIIIPASIKKNLLSELKLFGISKEYLFADSADEVFKNITDYYKSLYMPN